MPSASITSFSPVANCAASRAVSRRSRKVRGRFVKDFAALPVAHWARLRDSERRAFTSAGLALGECYCESFNGKLRDECLNGEIFYSLKEAQIIIESWRNHYNTKRPHSALGYRPPAPLAIAPKLDPAAIMN